MLLLVLFKRVDFVENIQTLFFSLSNFDQVLL